MPTIQPQKLLIISKYFYPDITPRAFRATELAKEFGRQGHEVTVIIPTRKRDYSEFEREHRLRIVNLGDLKFLDIHIYGNIVQRLWRKFLRRTLQIFFEYPDIQLIWMVAKTLRKETGHDLLISIAVPHPVHWGVSKVWIGNGVIAKKWIADCGDPYMLARLDTFNRPFYFKFFERRFCRKCDYITIPFEGARVAYYSEFHHKIKVIPQGFRLDSVNIPPFVKQYTYPRFAYAGGFIQGHRDPRPLLDYLSVQKGYFKFYIFSSQHEMLAPYKESLNDRLELLGTIQREELLLILAAMDFLINLDNNKSEHLPSKLIDYALTKRPVLNIRKDSDFSMVNNFLGGDYSGQMDLEDLGKYDIKTVTGQFLAL